MKSFLTNADYLNNGVEKPQLDMRRSNSSSAFSKLHGSYQSLWANGPETTRNKLKVKLENLFTTTH